MNPLLSTDYVPPRLLQDHWPFDRKAWYAAWKNAADGDLAGNPKNKRQARSIWNGRLKKLPWWDRIPYFITLSRRCRAW